MIGAILGIGSKILGSVIGKSVGGGLIDKAGGIVEKFVDQKGRRETAVLEHDAKSLDQFAAESAAVRDNRTWFDSLVDGLNRLPRPLAFFLTVWIFVWPLWNMQNFQNAMVSYESIPEWLAILITIVWTFYFGGRMMTKDMKGFKARGSKEIKEMLTKQKEIHEALTKKDPDNRVIPEVAPQYSPAQVPLSRSDRKGSPEDSCNLTAELASDKPLSLPSIVEWNRKNNPNF